MAEIEIKKNLIRDNIKSYENFPKPGIVFRDVFSILRKPELFSILRELLTSTAKTFELKPDVIVGIDSRGFLFGTLVALDLQIPFAPIRKKGKLPGQTKSSSYSLEYGSDTLEISINSIEKGQNILIIDDLLGTGGTLQTACNLIKEVGGNLSGCLLVIELKDLNGRSKVNCPVQSVIQY